MTTRYEKTIAGILVFFAGVTLILGFFQMQKTLRAPLLFDAPKKVVASAERTATFTPDPTKDTDGDGLLDVDELNRYGTSPYLADSDSDGKSDRIEIEKGGDPNCPEGRQCGALVGGDAVKTGEEHPRLLTDILERETLAITPSETVSAPKETGSATELRNALRAYGISDEQLNKIDDATLLEMYRETEVDQQKKGTNESTTTPKLTGPEIRALLRSQGMTEEELIQITDAQLESLFLEGIKQKFQNNP